MTVVADPSVRDEEITAFFSADPATIAWPYPMYDRWRAGHRRGPLAGRPGHADHPVRRRQGVMGGAYPIRQNAYRFGELAEGTIAGCRRRSTRSSSRSSTSRATS